MVQSTAAGILSSFDPVCVGGKANTAMNPVSTEGLFTSELLVSLTPNQTVQQI